MLSVSEKKTAAAKFFRDRHFFGAASFSNIRDAHVVVAIPNSQAQPPASRHVLLLRYHRLLFSARDNPCAFDETLCFTWHDSFRPHPMSRATEEGVRAACREFQGTTGALRAVGEMIEEEEATTVDMSSQPSAMLERLMLAQAQECYFEHALATGKLPLVCSNVARQVRFTDCTLRTSELQRCILLFGFHPRELRRHRHLPGSACPGPPPRGRCSLLLFREGMRLLVAGHHVPIRVLVLDLLVAGHQVPVHVLY